MVLNNNLLKEIQKNIMVCEKPSLYLENIKSNFLDTPLEIFLKLEETEQSPIYHPEGSVWNHVLLVTDTASMVKEYANNKEEFMMAAFMHDLGKATTTRKNKAGKWISYNHDIEGEIIAEKILSYYNYDEISKKIILKLIRYHMHHIFILKDMSFGNIDHMIENVDLNDMILLFMCDRLGRGQSSQEKKHKEINDIRTVINIIESKKGIDLNRSKGILDKISEKI